MKPATLIAIFISAASALTVKQQGVPVLVNPESMLATNQMASAPLGFPLLVGPDDLSV